MNQNIHVFAQPYWDSLYRAAERLTDEELDERITFYEEKQEQYELRNRGGILSKLWEKVNEKYELGALWGIPLAMVTIPSILYHKLFPVAPLILDGVSPLVNPKDAYRAAVQLKNFRRKEKSS